MNTREEKGGPVSQPWWRKNSELLPGERECTCCQKKFSDDGAHAMLELDQRDDIFHDFRDVPEDQSQGWFPFGLKCARKLRAAALEARSALSTGETK